MRGGRSGCELERLEQVRLCLRQVAALEQHEAEVDMRDVVALGHAQRLLKQRLAAAPRAHLRGGGEAEQYATIHYRRPAGDYGDATSSNYVDFWGLHTWDGAADPGWTTPRTPTGEDLFGVVFEVPLNTGAERMGYILHRGDEKDPGPDLILDFGDDGYEVWQLQGADPLNPYVLPVPR